MKRGATFVLGLTLAAFAVPAPPAAAEPVDLLLVLSADVSRSVDAEKFKLQRQGYAEAFADRRVLNSITGGRYGRIAVAFVEWAGVEERILVVDWTLIKDAETAKQFGDRLLEAPRSFMGRTSISTGIDFALTQLARAPFEAERKIVDVSGDGTNNSGRDVRAARDEAVARGVTVNGLVILSAFPLPTYPQHTHPPGGLANYYRDNVIGGDGAFVMTAQDFQSFGRAIINKLVKEIAEAR